MQRTIFATTILQFFIIGVYSHPAKPPLDDPTKARLLFLTAEAQSASIHDGRLTSDDLEYIFATFNTNNDLVVTDSEFIQSWTNNGLGSEESARCFFSIVDTDKDRRITSDPDITRVFRYFDANGDQRIDELEFIIVWLSLTC